MKKSGFVRVLAFVLLLTLTACTAAVPTYETAGDPTAAEDGAGNDAAPDFTPLAAAESEVDVHLPEELGNVLSLTFGEGEELYIAGGNRSVLRCTPDGGISRNYRGTNGIFGLQYHDGFLYGLQDRDLVRFDVLRGRVETLYSDLPVIQVTALDVTGTTVYLAAMTSIDFAAVPAADGDGYINYGEKLLVLDLETGNLEERVPVENFITFYRGEDGRFWLYAHPENHYILYEYDPTNGKTAKTAEMDDAGYARYFIHENETFVFSSMTGQVRAMDLKTGKVYDLSDVTPVTRAGNCFTWHDGRIYFLEETSDPDGHGWNVTNLHTLSWRDGLFEDGAVPRKRLVIANTIDGVFMAQFVDLDEVCRRSGIRAATTDNNHLNESAYLTSLMAGDNEADIYVLKSNYCVMDTCLQNMGYVPLNDSEKITGFLDGCFDWVRDAVTLENGDIAMFPLWFDLPAVWCSEQLFDQFGLTTEDFATFDRAMETHERILQEKGDYTTLFHHQDSFWNLLLQYESLYCDYEKGAADFKTETFTHLFDQLFTGWDWRGDVFHPVMEYGWQSILDDRDVHRELREKGVHWGNFEYYPHNNIYTVIRSRVYINMDLFRDSFCDTDSPIDVEIREKCMPPPVEGSWRVLPMPRLTEEVDKNYCTEAHFLVINPNSRKIDLAVEFLETMAEDIQACTLMKLFIQKDLSAYEGYVDMTEPVWQDVYGLFENAAVSSVRLDTDVFFDPVREYEHGIITLDEAVAEIDRRAKFFAGE